METMVAPLPCASCPAQACVPRIVPRMQVKLWGGRADAWRPVINPKAMNQRRALDFRPVSVRVAEWPWVTLVPPPPSLSSK